MSTWKQQSKEDGDFMRFVLKWNKCQGVVPEQSNVNNENKLNLTNSAF